MDSAAGGILTFPARDEEPFVLTLITGDPFYVVIVL